ncbi:dTMP kinase [Halarchaeum sp. CBA1220]|uniref:dTMP kinase n=1 Tax=Halarchaeum sp. CBA1220 TaxID=1853682 RepID=UPI000F3A9F45|nr:dTMP kinase [Halarchaeum sp. CBA1220]QLC33045.1 dTMP kinase [Halarchaeum sp. CBA1220]
MLVTLEGIDGSGKTTVWEALRETRDDGYAFTREPTDSWYGEAVLRSVRDDDADPLAEAFLYTADHAAHLSRLVRPALERGDVVVSDRYSDSRYAYQGVALSGRVPRPMRFLRDVHEPWTREPDLTLYFDVDPHTAAERAGATNKFEQAEFLADVRENYERLVEADPERFVRIDATQSPDAVAERVEAVFDARVD